MPFPIITGKWQHAVICNWNQIVEFLKQIAALQAVTT